MDNKLYMLTYPGAYVAAVITGGTALKDYMNSVEPDLLAKLDIRPLRCSYPFQILESRVGNERSFHVLDTDYLQKNFANDLKKLRPETKLCATYDLTKDYLGDPKNPGRDYMGILPHDHFWSEEDDEDETDQID